MRVLLTADTVGGVWDYTVTHASALVARGHEVLIAAIGPPGAFAGRDLPQGVQVTAADFRLEWMPGAEHDLGPAAEWLGAVARTWRADLAHLNQLTYSAFELGVPKLVVAHSDVLSWLGATRNASAHAEWDDYGRRVQAGLRGADLVVAPTRYQSDLLRRHYGRAADRVIHNGWNADPAEASPRQGDLVITAGRAWDEGKGMDLLEAALEQLGPTAPAAHLFGPLEGPGGERFRPRRLVSHGVVAQTTLAAWMSRACVYVGTSRYEPFGLAPLQAALRGCPLVLSDIGSFRELWSGCATFFRAGSGDSLASTLSAALAEPHRMREQAEAARTRAVDLYGSRRMVDEYLAAYEQLNGARAGAPIGVES